MYFDALSKYAMVLRRLVKFGLAPEKMHVLSIVLQSVKSSLIFSNFFSSVCFQSCFGTLAMRDLSEKFLFYFIFLNILYFIFIFIPVSVNLLLAMAGVLHDKGDNQKAERQNDFRWTVLSFS